ncbi:MAG: ArnT family glycosyltransferase [Hyphomicrobium sp.]
MRSSHCFPKSLPTLLAVLAAIAALRIAALAFNATDLFVDEAQYWAWSRELDFGYYSKPPLIAWIIAAFKPLCGDGEVCVRLPAVLTHLATSLVVYVIGLRLSSERVGFWSAVTFATLPGISVSSGIISTDVPLLFAWAVALLAFAELVVVPSVSMSILLGVALGLGLNAKYAMAYFIPCAALFFLLAPARAAVLRTPYLWLSLAIAAAAIVPNVLWNAAHDFATLSHTADNANWSGSLFHPGRALEFFGAQFGVFGPILFGALMVIAARAWTSRQSLSDEDRLLIAFSLPIILALTVQGLLSRSLANWAAPAYIAATVLVVSVMIRRSDWGWLKGSLAINSTAAVVYAVALSLAGKFTLPGGDPFTRTLGNREMAEVVVDALVAPPGGEAYAGILTDDRDVTAALLYYARNIPVPVHAWRAGERPRNHFELKRPFEAAEPRPVLLVSRRADAGGIDRHFGSAIPLGAVQVPAGRTAKRTVHLFALSGFQGR